VVVAAAAVVVAVAAAMLVGLSEATTRIAFGVEVASDSVCTDASGDVEGRVAGRPLASVLTGDVPLALGRVRDRYASAAFASVPPPCRTTSAARLA